MNAGGARGGTALRLALVERARGWRRACPAYRLVTRRAARAAFDAGRRLTTSPAAVEISLVLGDDALVRRLNCDWRGQDRPTNVLAFAAGDDAAAATTGTPQLLGDVVLAQETIVREALAQGKSVADHLAHLVVHGVLHLLGHDHRLAREAKRMEALEVRILGHLGVADPYRADIRPAMRRRA